MVKKRTWKILHLGHLGAGSIFGMTKEDEEENKYQQWLREKWNETKQLVGPVNLLVVGGEIIEGENYKGKQEDLYISRKLDQLDIAEDLVLEWISKSTEEVLIPYGHLYHGSKEGRVERELATRMRRAGINARYGTIFERPYFGLNFRFWHGSSNAYVYKAGQKERAIKFNLEQAGIGKTTMYDQEYTYHTHQFYRASFRDKVATSCPAWKLLDTWGQLKRPDVWLPDIGVVVTTLEKRFGGLRVNNDVIYYNQPFRFEDLEQAKINNAPRAREQWVPRKMPVALPPPRRGRNSIPAQTRPAVLKPGGSDKKKEGI